MMNTDVKTINLMSGFVFTAYAVLSWLAVACLLDADLIIATMLASLAICLLAGLWWKQGRSEPTSRLGRYVGFALMIPGLAGLAMNGFNHVSGFVFAALGALGITILLLTHDHEVVSL